MKPLQHTVKAKIIEILLQWARRKPLYHQKTSSNSTWDFLHITRWGGGSERDKEINETSNGYSFSLLWSIDWAEDHLSAVQSSQCLPSSKEHQEKLQRVFQTPQETETIVEANAWGAFDGSQTRLQCCLDFHHCVLIHCVLKLSPPLPLIFCPQASLHTCFIALLLAESQLNKQDHCKNVPEALMKVHCSALCKKIVFVLVWSLKCALLTFSPQSYLTQTTHFQCKSCLFSVFAESAIPGSSPWLLGNKCNFITC